MGPAVMYECDWRGAKPRKPWDLKVDLRTKVKREGRRKRGIRWQGERVKERKNKGNKM